MIPGLSSAQVVNISQKLTNFQSG